MNIDDLINKGHSRITYCDEVYIVNLINDDNFMQFRIMREDGISSGKVVINPNTAEAFICSLSTAEPDRKLGFARKMMSFIEELGNAYCKKLSFELSYSALLVENLDWRYEWYKRLGFKDDFHDAQLFLRKNYGCDE